NRWCLRDSIMRQAEPLILDRVDLRIISALSNVLRTAARSSRCNLPIGVQLSVSQGVPPLFPAPLRDSKVIARRKNGVLVIGEDAQLICSRCQVTWENKRT